MPDLLSIETWRTLFTKHGSKLGWGLAVLFGAPLVVGFGVSQYANRANNVAEANADRNATVAVINGVEIPRQQYMNLAFSDRSQVGEQAAIAQDPRFAPCTEHRDRAGSRRPQGSGE